MQEAYSPYKNNLILSDAIKIVYASLSISTTIINACAISYKQAG
jgi:hypothetical protein